MLHQKVKNQFQEYQLLHRELLREMSENTQDNDSEQPVPSELRPEYRYKMILMDDQTQVQLPVATDNLDKFTKTDMMKVVKAFKEAVAAEESKWEKPIEKKKKDNTESAERSDSSKVKRVRRTRKVQ
jgi:hypothetical protein